MLTAGRVPSLPYLSEELAFRRSHGMVYQGLTEGRVDEDALRDLLVRWRPADWPCVFGIDASTIGRPWAVTSPGREFHHHSCEVLEVNEPSLLRWSWIGDEGGDVTEVTYRLEPHAGGTRFTYEHTGFTGVGGVFMAKLLGHVRRKMLTVGLPSVLNDLDDDAA